MDQTTLTHNVKQLAIKNGFDQVGISRAEFMEPEARRLEEWLSQEYHGQMSYMANHFDKRVDPRLLVPGAKTVISLTHNYFYPEKQEDAEAPKISMYAYGKDYHKVLRKKLKQLFIDIQQLAGNVEGRYFVDSAPVLERDWAKRSGLGWVGKHTLLLNKKRGSYFFLAEIILDLELDPDPVVRDHCGDCTRCIDACPTEAISPAGYLLDASKCISYLTIELKNAIPKEFSDKMDDWMFGCDICQEVCPWNRFSVPHSEDDFLPKQQILSMSKEEWELLTEEVFDILFENSAVKRTKYHGLKRNISFLKRKSM